MELIFQVILFVIIILTALPVGWLLAWLCKDEIVFRKWFYVLFYFFIAVAIILLIFTRPVYEILTIFYIILLILLAIYKSKDKKFFKN